MGAGARQVTWTLRQFYSGSTAFNAAVFASSISAMSTRRELLLRQFIEQFQWRVGGGGSSGGGGGGGGGGGV